MGSRFMGIREAMTPLMNALAGETVFWTQNSDGAWLVLASSKPAPVRVGDRVVVVTEGGHVTYNQFDVLFITPSGAQALIRPVNTGGDVGEQSTLVAVGRLRVAGQGKSGAVGWRIDADGWKADA